MCCWPSWSPPRLKPSSVPAAPCCECPLTTSVCDGIGGGIGGFDMHRGLCAAAHALTWPVQAMRTGGVCLGFWSPRCCHQLRAPSLLDQHGELIHSPPPPSAPPHPCAPSACRDEFCQSKDCSGPKYNCAAGCFCNGNPKNLKCVASKVNGRKLFNTGGD